MSQHADAQALLPAILSANKVGQSVVLATIIRSQGSTPRRTGAKMLVYEDGKIAGTIGGGEMESRVIEEALKTLHTKKPLVMHYALVDPKRGDPGVCGGEVEIFLEPYLPPATVWVIGAGHVGQAVAHLAKWLGFRVVVYDDRADLASPEHIPDADLYLTDPNIEQVLADFIVTNQTYIVAVTRNIMVDHQILPHLVQTPAPYIGLIGSQRRWLTTQALLKEDGLGEEDLQRIHSPIGLELNAETPAEIAVSIMAEIVRHHRHTP